MIAQNQQLPTPAWRTSSVAIEHILIDAGRFQRRESVDPERIRALEEAGIACCGAPFCPHRYEMVELWEDAETRRWLLAGHHRLTLALKHGPTHIDARVAVGWSEAAAIAYAARSNARVKPYAPLEEAAIFRDLSDRGWSWERISADYDGRRPEYYRKRAGLSYLADTLKTGVRDGTLRVEYAEVIGEAARKGLPVSGQQYLRDLARTSGRRIEVFRAVVDALIARSEVKTEQGALFDFASDQAVAAIQDAMQATTAKLKERDLWAVFVRSGQQVLRSSEEQPDDVVSAIDRGRREVTRIERDLGVEGSALADVDDGVAAVASPILKWAGSKVELLPQIVPVVRRALERGTGKLFEPFAGGASVTLAVGPKAGVLADQAMDLIDLYGAVQTCPEDLHRVLGQLRQKGTSEEVYYAIRDGAFPVGDVEIACVYRAARTIYLNRVGYNGLYRTNRGGKFNVPHGKKADGSDLTPRWPTLADLKAVARALEHVECLQGGWEQTLARAAPGDTLYIDSPFFGTFDGYGKKWREEDHAHLASTLQKLHLFGCHVIVSQPDCEEAKRWYVWTAITEVAKTYAVGGKKSRRKAKGELLCVALAR